MKISNNVTKNLPVTVKIAESQEEFLTVPAHMNCGITAFAYDLDADDLEKINKGKRIYIHFLTGSNDMQPFNVQLTEEEFEEQFKYNVDFMLKRGYIDRESYIEVGDRVEWRLDSKTVMKFIVKKSDGEIVNDYEGVEYSRDSLTILKKWYRIEEEKK